MKARGKPCFFLCWTERAQTRCKNHRISQTGGKERAPNSSPGHELEQLELLQKGFRRTKLQLHEPQQCAEGHRRNWGHWEGPDTGRAPRGAAAGGEHQEKQRWSSKR